MCQLLHLLGKSPLIWWAVAAYYKYTVAGDESFFLISTDINNRETLLWAGLFGGCHSECPNKLRHELLPLRFGGQRGNEISRNLHMNGQWARARVRHTTHRNTCVLLLSPFRHFHTHLFGGKESPQSDRIHCYFFEQRNYVLVGSLYILEVTLGISIAFLFFLPFQMCGFFFLLVCRISIWSIDTKSNRLSRRRVVCGEHQY